MKKLIIGIIIAMNIVTIQAGDNIPTYKIIANSNNEDDVAKIYEIKDSLLKEYAKWSKGVDDPYQVLADHTSVYQAKFYNGEYVVVVGDGKGKSITGKLQVSYCSSTKEIKKKSLLEELFS